MKHTTQNVMIKLCVHLIFIIFLSSNLSCESSGASNCEKVQLTHNQLSSVDQVTLKKCVDDGSTSVTLIPFIVVGNYSPPANKVPLIFQISGEELKILWFESPEDASISTKTGPLVQAFNVVRKAYKNAQKFVGSAWNTATRPLTSFFGRRTLGGDAAEQQNSDSQC